VHCFTGSEEKLSELVRRGFMIGLTGFICMQERGAHLRAAIQRGVIDLNKVCVCVCVCVRERERARARERERERARERERERERGRECE
jgi:hypothetical protein